MKIFAIAAAIAAVAATGSAALAPQDKDNYDYVTQGKWGGSAPINIIWDLPAGGTPDSWKTTYTASVPKGTASVNIEDKRAIKVTLGPNTDYWKAPTVVFEKPTNVRPPKDYSYSKYEVNEYGYYSALEEDDSEVLAAEDAYTPTEKYNSYKPTKGYKQTKGYGKSKGYKPTDKYYPKDDDYYKPSKSYKPKKELLKCTLQEFVFHSISEHQYQGDNFALEIEFKHTCEDNSIAVFHQLYNVRYVQPPAPKPKKTYYDSYKKSSTKGYLDTLVAEVYDSKNSKKSDDYYHEDDDYYQDEEDDYYEDEEDDYYQDEEDDYYRVNKFEETFKTLKQEDKDEKASNTLRKIVNFVAANLITVTKTGTGYEAVYTPVPTQGKVTAPIDFKFGIRELFDVSQGYYGYIGSETYTPWNPAYVFVSGNTLNVDVKVAEFQQFVHALTASINYKSSDATNKDVFPHRYEVYNNRLVRPVGNRTVWGYAATECTPFWSAPVAPLKYYGKPYNKQYYDKSYATAKPKTNYYPAKDDYKPAYTGPSQ